MSKTEVRLTYSDGACIPSLDSVAVIAGDTVSFSVTNGPTAFAFFSPDAISVLSPKPLSPLALLRGKPVHFSFSSSGPGAYSAYFATDAQSGPAHYPADRSDLLRLEIVTSDAPPFTGPGDTMTSGH